MTSVWKSNLSRHIKVSFFQATVESVVLYGCESWTLKETLRKSVDGCSTRMLRAVLNISGSKHVANMQLYDVLSWSRDCCIKGECNLPVTVTDIRSFQLANLSNMGAVICIPTITFVEVLRRMLGWRALWSWPSVWRTEKIRKYVGKLF